MNHHTRTPSGSRVALLACLGCLLLPCGSALAKPYTLNELLDMARKGNPGVAAAAQATAGIEAQVLEARRSLWPTGELTSLLAPMTEIRCQTDIAYPAGSTLSEHAFREQHCVRTDFTFDKGSTFDAITNLHGVFTRTELKLVQPLYTFGKYTAGMNAAQQGAQASRSRESGTLSDVELNVRKAYWGAKLAREISATLKEGTDYLDEAQSRIDKELAEGTGSASVTDRLRLRTMRAEVEARVLEARRGAELARSGLRALIGPTAPADLEVDEAELKAEDVPPRSLAQYQEQATSSRPEVKALEHLVATKRALADLEWRRQYPDLALVATAQYAYSSSVDQPRNAFYNNPYNSSGAGIGAFFRMPLDLGVKNARAARLRAEAEETERKRHEAMAGVGFEVEKAHAELQEAAERIKSVQKGEKASKQWIAAIMQNLAVGVAEAKDFSDALLAFFQARIRTLQSVYDYNIAAASLTRATGIDVSAK